MNDIKTATGTYTAIHVTCDGPLTDEAKAAREYLAAYDKHGRTWRVTEEQAAQIEAANAERLAKKGGAA